MCKDDHLKTRSKLTSMISTPSGKEITVQAEISKNGEKMIEIISKFMIKGFHSGYCFRKVKESPFELHLRSNIDIEVLKSKPWINHLQNVNVGDVLVFRLYSFYNYEGESVVSYGTYGNITTKASSKDIIMVGDVSYRESSKGFRCNLF